MRDGARQPLVSLHPGYPAKPTDSGRTRLPNLGQSGRPIGVPRQQSTRVQFLGLREPAGGSPARFRSFQRFTEIHPGHGPPKWRENFEGSALLRGGGPRFVQQGGLETLNRPRLPPAAPGCPWSGGRPGTTRLTASLIPLAQRSCPLSRILRGMACTSSAEIYFGIRTESTRYTVALAVWTPPQITAEPPSTLSASLVPVTVTESPSTVLWVPTIWSGVSWPGMTW